MSGQGQSATSHGGRLWRQADIVTPATDRMSSTEQWFGWESHPGDRFNALSRLSKAPERQDLTSAVARERLALTVVLEILCLGRGLGSNTAEFPAGGRRFCWPSFLLCSGRCLNRRLACLDERNRLERGVISQVVDFEPVCPCQRIGWTERIARYARPNRDLGERLTERLWRARCGPELHHHQCSEANKDESRSHLISCFPDEYPRPEPGGNKLPDIGGQLPWSNAAA